VTSAARANRPRFCSMRPARSSDATATAPGLEPVPQSTRRPPQRQGRPRHHHRHRQPSGAGRRDHRPRPAPHLRHHPGARSVPTWSIVAELLGHARSRRPAGTRGRPPQTGALDLLAVDE
jgi:hypothetical protein